MGTRSVFTFKDGYRIARVYQHWDGYPSGAVDAIRAALSKAWPLPRYEPDEFASAFITANKSGAGNYRVIGSVVQAPETFLKPYEFAFDIEYSYLIEPGDDLMITAYEIGADGEEVQIFKGSLSEMETWTEDRGQDA